MTERVDSAGALEEDESSSVGSSYFEEPDDPRVQEEVGGRNDGVSNSIEICILKLY